jgi:tRNA(Ile)-lysidine synthase
LATRSTSRALERRVRDFIAAHHIFDPGPVVVACSGGPDSFALLGILHALSGELGLVLHVAHFDHRMRATSDRDAGLVRGVAAELGLPSHLDAAARPPRSEGEAREVRYRFLRGIMRDTGAKAIALGHTEDDQAETVLLHLVRGSGVVGLASMRPRREELARPLLCLTREETLAYVKAKGLRVARDPSNRSERFARNLIRLRVLPLLERLNPKARQALARVADNAALLADVLRSSAEAALGEALVAEEERIVLDLERLSKGDGIASEALALAAERAGAGALSERHRHALLALARSDRGSARLDLPHGVLALREYTRLSIGAPPTDAAPPAPARLEAGRVLLWGAWTFTLDAASERPLPLRARVPRADSLIVRAWHSGDRLAGGGKVQDVLTDAKVPRRARHAYPVVVTPSGDVVWVPGLAQVQAEPGETDLTLAARPPDGVPA